MGCSCEHEHTHDGKNENLHKTENKIVLIKMVLAVILTVAGMVFEKYIYVSLSLFLLAYIVIAYKVVFSAILNIAKGEIFDENFLMTIASIGAMAIGEFAEGIAVILLYTIGNMFEEMAIGKSQRSIEALLSIKPEYTNLQTEEGYVEVDPAEVPIGSVILVKPGEKVPIDGVIMTGISTLDTKAITGESLPVEVESGNNIYSGSVNITGALVVKTTVLYEESTVARIIELTKNAQDKKSKSEQFITKFSKYYTPIVVILAVLIALVPSVFIGFSENFSDYLKRALMFLVVSCPCALVISVPLTYFGAVGNFSANGVLVKGSNYIELLNSIKTVIFDKTGTLTEGEFKIFEIKTAEGIAEEELIEALIIAEKTSNHPLAQAIIRTFSEDKRFVEPLNAEVAEFNDFAGKGICAIWEKGKIYAGNEKFMFENSVETSFLSDIAGSVVHVKAYEKYLGYVLLGDNIKDSAKETIAFLNSSGIKTVMLTGDGYKAAEKAAKELAVSEFKASLLPADKVGYLEKYMENSKTMFIGDGINDAPSIMRADIGVAMGEKGSEYAVEISDIVLANDDVYKLPFMFKAAKKTRRIVIQNIVFALGVKFAILSISALGGGNIWLAIFADVGVSILAIMNSLRMLRVE